MNHIAIVVKQLNDKAAKLRDDLAGVEAAIKALGGTVKATATAPGKPVARRSRSDKGKPRGGKGKAATSAANGEPVSPALQAELDAIKANAKLSPIQKAQASRKARAAARTAPSPQPQGAPLAAAAS